MNHPDKHASGASGSSGVALEVHACESGMKLLRFLERRLLEATPKSALHKWIRTGQVRVNGGRAKPFLLLAAGDLVRLPPFARTRLLAGEELPSAQGAPCPGLPVGSEEALQLGEGLSLLARNGQVLVLAKAAGLACQPGSGQHDSVAARLASAFADAAFIPAPAHRIDRHTSGLILAGTSHAAQAWLHALFASGSIRKDYLAWVWGDWTPQAPCLLEDRLEKRETQSGREAITALPGGTCLSLTAGNGKAITPLHAASAGTALSVATPLLKLQAKALPPPLGRLAEKAAPPTDTQHASPRPAATLLLLRLITGRTHQLRVQLASRGFPIIGDGRYHGPRFSCMLLHAFALTLPPSPEAAVPPFRRNSPPLDFNVAPPWPEAFLLEASLLARARQELDALLDLSMVE